MAKILLVDDEPAILKMYSESLKESGFDVVTAATGEEGVNLAKSAQPDIILLDIMMPRLNGFDTVKELKSDSETKAIPIYLLTNLPENASGQKPKELGVAGYLVKAEVEPDELAKIVTEALKK